MMMIMFDALLIVVLIGCFISAIVTLVKMYNYDPNEKDEGGNKNE